MTQRFDTGLETVAWQVVKSGDGRLEWHSREDDGASVSFDDRTGQQRNKANGALGDRAASGRVDALAGPKSHQNPTKGAVTHDAACRSFPPPYRPQFSGEFDDLYARMVTIVKGLKGYISHKVFTAEDGREF